MKNLITILFIGIFSNLSFAQCEDFDVEIEIREPSCYAERDGNITLFVDGAEPFAIDITNTDGEAENSGDLPYAHFIGAGWYYLYVEDTEGCVFNDSVRLEEPAEMLIDLMVTPASDFGACDGAVEVEALYNYQGDFDAVFYSWGITGESGTGLTEVADVCADLGSGLMVTDEEGCMVHFDLEVGYLASITSDLLRHVDVFVNPETGALHVTRDDVQSFDLELFNLAGEVVFSSQVNESSAVIVPNLEAGVYVYKINRNGETMQTGKLKF